MSKTVLLVEDNSSFSDILKIAIESSHIEVVQAFNLNEGFNALDKYGSNLLCVVLGGKLGVSSTTLPLARKITEIGFQCPVISFSGDLDLQEKQMKAGCTNQFQKIQVREMISFIERLK